MDGRTGVSLYAQTSDAPGGPTGHKRFDSFSVSEQSSSIQDQETANKNTIVLVKAPRTMASPTPTIVLIPFCVPGHLASFLEAGKRLLAAGSASGQGATSLTVLVMHMPTGDGNLMMSDLADLMRREAVSGGRLDVVRFRCLPAVELPGDFHGAEDFMSRFIQLHEPHVKEAISGLDAPVAAVVMDYFCTTLFDVTRELGLRTYVYFASGASMLALLLRLPELEHDELGGAGVVVEVPGMPPVPASSMPEALMKKDPNYMWMVYHGRRFMEADGIVVNTAAELEPAVLAAIAGGRCWPERRGRVPTVYPIGPILSLTPSPAEKPHECVRWLDAQPPASVVLLCFGSMGSMPPPQVLALADGLERSGHRFLWVLRGPPAAGSPYPTEGDDAVELLPEGFLERTRERGLVWPRWAPQKEILAHPAVGGFVTHCGWNSVLESLWHGVPMTPWPLYAEQHLNAFELVSDVVGAAVAMEVDRKRGNRVEAAELDRAVRSLMDGGSEEGRKAREKAAEAKAALRGAVEKGGSSYVALRRLARDVSLSRDGEM